MHNSVIFIDWLVNNTQKRRISEPCSLPEAHSPRKKYRLTGVEVLNIHTWPYNCSVLTIFFLIILKTNTMFLCSLNDLYIYPLYSSSIDFSIFFLIYFILLITNFYLASIYISN
uniref:Uncharacterized protein n=1 Tax=Mus musculus TaxID=10090 RepID=Q3USV4_MOUSE|nr:unnamed protein product [Mus musculus]